MSEGVIFVDGLVSPETKIMTEQCPAAEGLILLKCLQECAVGLMLLLSLLHQNYKVLHA